MRQHRIQQVQRADIVDLVVPHHVTQIERQRAHVVVVARTVHGVVQPAAGHNGRAGCPHGRCIGRVQRHGDGTRVLRHKLVERAGVAGRHNDSGALCVQHRGGGPADAA